MPRLTQVAQEIFASVIVNGDLVIDATAGNGYDACKLAELVAPTGSLLAIDRQQAALDETAQRLAVAGLTDCATLVQGDHADLLSLVPNTWHGRVRAVVFNLGYLPGSDKSVITEPTSTRKALDASLDLLSGGGLLSVLIYRGHDGGHAEETMILEWLDENVGQLCDTKWNDGDHPTDSSPRLLTSFRAAR